MTATDVTEIITLSQKEGFTVVYYDDGTFWLREADEKLRTRRRCMSAAGNKGQRLNARKRSGAWYLNVRQGDLILDAEYDHATGQGSAVIYLIIGIDAAFSAGNVLNGGATLRVTRKSSLVGKLGEVDWENADDVTRDILQHVMGGLFSADDPQPDILQYGNR